MTGPHVAFRRLQRDDLPLLAGWLAEPLVARWWSHDSSLEAVERDFGPSIDGVDATELFLAMLADRPFGLVQRYPVAAYPEYVDELASVLPVPPGALSMDYLVGEADLRGRGLGAAMLVAFVQDCWRAHPAARDIVVPVAAGNTASWRALERAGLRRVATGAMVPDNPVDPPDHVVYLVTRHASTAFPPWHG